MQYPLSAILIAGVLTYAAATIVAGRIAASGFPLPEPERRIGRVDGLRGFLATSVLIGHAVIWTQITRLGGQWTPPNINLFNMLGAGSVALFFMVTGLLFYPRIRHGFRSISWPKFLVTRFFRIVPLQLVSVLAIVAIAESRTGTVPGADDLRSFSTG